MPFHLALPIQTIGGQYVVNEQDSQAEAKTQVRCILAFPKGSRAESMSFGVNDPTFEEMPIDVSDIAKAISDYAPDLDVEIQVTVDNEDGSETLNIRVSLPFSDDSDDERADS